MWRQPITVPISAERRTPWESPRRSSSCRRSRIRRCSRRNRAARPARRTILSGKLTVTALSSSTSFGFANTGWEWFGRIVQSIKSTRPRSTRNLGKNRCKLNRRLVSSLLNEAWDLVRGFVRCSRYDSDGCRACKGRRNNWTKGNARRLITRIFSHKIRFLL